MPIRIHVRVTRGTSPFQYATYFAAILHRSAPVFLLHARSRIQGVRTAVRNAHAPKEVQHAYGVGSALTVGAHGYGPGPDDSGGDASFFFFFLSVRQPSSATMATIDTFTPIATPTRYGPGGMPKKLKMAAIAAVMAEVSIRLQPWILA